MMAQVKYELVTKITRGDKERWQKMGVVFMGEKGPYAIIDQIPVGFTGMVSFFTPKDKDEPTSEKPKSAPSKKTDDDSFDVPF